jgi:YidC/Oxa1 family membrane protein insertase
MGEDVRRILIAVSLSFLIMFGWQRFFPHQSTTVSPLPSSQNLVTLNKNLNNSSENVAFVPEASNAPRIRIVTPSIKGSISTLGLIMDDICLLNHKNTIGEDSSPVDLLKKLSHFVSIRFASEDGSCDLPGSSTLWRSSGLILTPGTPVKLDWVNNQGIRFIVNIAVDENYLFTFDTSVVNSSQKKIRCAPCVQILKSRELINTSIQESSHNGAIGAVDKQIKDYSYKDLTKKGKLNINTQAFNWFGLTDKYWLTALISSKQTTASICLENLQIAGSEYVSNLISYADQDVNSASTIKDRFYLFAGAKHVVLLDRYRDELGALLLDRAIDFGWIYFLAKPLFHLLNFFFGLVKNFGISIILLTLMVRVCTFALAIKSEGTMRKMKGLQPKMQRLKELYKDDPEQLRKEIISLYKKEKISPIGCLPMLAQIPVFFGVYKVLEVALEMRHSPFFLWVSDLSARDPLNIFTLFGLLPWSPPSFLHLGIWPILMSVSMYLQQKISPKPDDPMQARMFAIMPLVMLCVLGNSPVGLMIYWTWNNCFGIGQQYLMNFLSKRKASI